RFTKSCHSRCTTTIRHRASLLEVRIDWTTIRGRDELGQAFSDTNSRPALIRSAVIKVGRLVKNRLRLKLRMNLWVNSGGRHPKISTKTNDCWLSTLAGGIHKDVGPVASGTLWTMTNVGDRVTGDQISHSYQPANHFGDRSIHESTGGPHSNIVNTNAETGLQPIQRHGPQQRPGGCLAGTNGCPGLDQFADRVVQHLNCPGNCSSNDGARIADTEWRSLRTGTVELAGGKRRSSS